MFGKRHKKPNSFLGKVLAFITCAFIIYFSWDTTFNSNYITTLSEKVFWYKIKDRVEAARKVPDAYWEDKYDNLLTKNKYKIAIFTSSGGEWSSSQYIKQAAKNLGWEAKIFYATPLGNDESFLAFDPDFVIIQGNNIDDSYHLFFGPIGNHRSKKYFYYNTSFIARDNLNGTVNFTDFYNNFFPAYIKFVARSDATIFVSKEIELFQDLYKQMQKEFVTLRFFPLTHSVEFSPAEANKIFIYGVNWDNLRRGEKYRNFFQILGQNEDISVYGRYHKFLDLKEYYQGFIKGDADSVIETIRKNGIYLLMHNDETQIKTGTPTNRIFEAIAANVIIISDKHPFVVENFGNNILYFDHEADAETMAKQVIEHIKWVKANPEKAKIMANNCHKIFHEKFTMEKQLVKLAKLHEYILLQDKKYEFPFKY